MAAELPIWTKHKVTVREMATALHKLLYHKISKGGRIQLR